MKDINLSLNNFDDHLCQKFPVAEPSAPPLPASNEYSQNLHSNNQKNTYNGTSTFQSSNYPSTLTPPPNAVDDEPEPSAPPLELLDKVTGYEYASFDIVDVPPPSIPVMLNDDENLDRTHLPSEPKLTEKEARQALHKYVSRHCCYGKSVAQDMSITKIVHSCAFHYTLESFTEKRQTSWAFEPYTGDPISSISSGTPTLPWNLPASPPAPFQNSNTKIEVPHTAVVKTCHTCGGVGRKRCFTCSGNGWEYCYSCHGDGRRSSFQGESERCFQCHGTGRRRCWKCNGDGMSACKCCTGTGQIKCFIQLHITWTNHMDEHIVDRASVPDEKLKNVSGQIVLSEEHPKLRPIDHFPDTTINMASLQLIQQHSTAFIAEKLLMQRHEVRIIPISTVFYRWKNFESSFNIYGFEHKVYAPDYPQTCCCGCTVL